MRYSIPSSAPPEFYYLLYGICGVILLIFGVFYFIGKRNSNKTDEIIDEILSQKKNIKKESKNKIESELNEDEE